MVIFQITDLHIGFDGPEAPCANSKRLRRALRSLKEREDQIDLVLITGDLVEQGESWAYESLKKTLSKIKVPIYFAMGNHDERSAFASVFPDAEFNEGFLQYVVEDHAMRLIVLDTLEPGRHGGSFCEARAAWLEAKLSEQPTRPTFLAMHHPPIETGIGWMTAQDDAPWVQRLKAVIERHDQIVHIATGHIHRCIHKGFAGTTLSVSRAVAPQVKLDLRPIDPTQPDDRVLLVDSDAGFCLHHWDGHDITVHHAIAPEGRPIIHYDDKHAFVVPLTLDLNRA